MTNEERDAAKEEFAKQIFYGRFADNERISNLTGGDVKALFDCLYNAAIDEFVRRLEVKCRGNGFVSNQNLKMRLRAVAAEMRGEGDGSR